MHSHMHSHSCIHIYVQYIQVPLLYLYSNFFLRIYTYVQPIHMDNQLWSLYFRFLLCDLCHFDGLNLDTSLSLTH